MSFKTVGVRIDGSKTDIAISEYENSFLIIITQFEKIGTIVSVRKESLQEAEGERIVYEIKTELGDAEGPGHIVARYLVEQLAIDKPVVLGVCLRDSSLPTLRAIVQVLRSLHSSW